MSFFSALTGADTSSAIESGSRMQQDAARRSEEIMRQEREQGRQDVAPWLQAGRRGLEEQQNLMGFGGDTAGAMRALQSSPGYQFSRNQGMQNFNASLSARGGMGSGKAMAAGQNYVQGRASQEYGNRLSQLSGLSEQGRSTATGQAQAGERFGSNLGNLWTGAANARAAARMAGAQANQSGLMGLAQLGLAGYSAFNAPRSAPREVPQQAPYTPSW